MWWHENIPVCFELHNNDVANRTTPCMSVQVLFLSDLMASFHSAEPRFYWNTLYCPPIQMDCTPKHTVFLLLCNRCHFHCFYTKLWYRVLQHIMYICIKMNTKHILVVNMPNKCIHLLGIKWSKCDADSSWTEREANIALFSGHN